MPQSTSTSHMQSAPTEPHARPSSARFLTDPDPSAPQWAVSTPVLRPHEARSWSGHDSESSGDLQSEYGAADSEEGDGVLDDCKVFIAHGLMDGATSLQEMVSKLRAAADQLEQLQDMGYELEGDVEDDEAHLIRPAQAPNPADVQDYMEGAVATLN